jgi:arginyl-tRNA synthetase
VDPRALAALIRESASRHLGQAPQLTEDDIALERPKNRDHGDWATSIALKLAKVAGSNPGTSLPPSPRSC